FEHANALVDVWQSNRQSETFALATLNGEFAAMLAHNAAHNQQSEAGARRLGCKIRLKNATQVCRRHTAAGIHKPDEDERIVQIGANAQSPMALHCFETVFNHVVKRLFHLITIKLEQRQVRAQFLFDNDVAVLNFGHEKAHCLLDDRVDILRTKLRLLILISREIMTRPHCSAALVATGLLAPPETRGGGWPVCSPTPRGGVATTAASRCCITSGTM